MYDSDQITDSPELRQLRDSISGVAAPGPPPLAAITARGRAYRRRRLTTVTRLSAAGVVAATAVALAASGAFTQAAKLGTIRTAAFTLHKNSNGTDTLTLNPVELLNPTELQSDLAEYGIPAKVTTDSYCTSNPEPPGFSQAVISPGPGTGEGGPGQPPPEMTIDPSKIPAGAELSVGDFQLVSGQFAGSKQANMSLINASSSTCSSTPPDMSDDTSDGDLGILYGGPGSSGS